ncbi:MAG: hypothetical protein ACOH1I_02805 [Gallionellaceae bacterium]|jgi:hypothetical protein
MNKIGAVNNICDSLVKQKTGQQRAARAARKKVEKLTDKQVAQDVEFPLESDTESLVGQLLDTSA